MVVASIVTSSMSAMSAKSAIDSMSRLVVSAVWCGPAGGQPGLGRDGQARPGPPDGPGDRQVRQRRVGLDDVDLAGDQPEPVAEVGQAEDDRGTRRRVEHEPDRVGAAADRERVDLARGPVAGERRADLEHVGAEDLGDRVAEVVGVVLHERRPAGQPVGHDLQDPDERGRLPVALGAEAVAVGHQPLDADARQLLERAEVLERVGERAEAAVLDERPQAGLDPGRRPQLGVALAAPAQRQGDVVCVLVLRDQVVDRRVADRGHAIRQVAHAVAVDREAEPRLGLDLVALGDRDVAHVVAEPGDLEAMGLVPAGRRPRPRAEPRQDGRVLPVADDRLAAPAQPRLDERELAVAVGGLVQVHEVHVDVGPGQVAVVLGVEVDEGLAQVGQPADPHLGRAERVHPGDDADARRRRVGLAQDRGDRLGRRDDRLGHDPDRHRGRLVEAAGDVAGVLVDPVQDRLAVQVLAAGHEPRLQAAQARPHGPGPSLRLDGHFSAPWVSPDT